MVQFVKWSRGKNREEKKIYRFFFFSRIFKNCFCFLLLFRFFRFFFGSVTFHFKFTASLFHRSHQYGFFLVLLGFYAFFFFLRGNDVTNATNAYQTLFIPFSYTLQTIFFPLMSFFINYCTIVEHRLEFF